MKEEILNILTMRDILNKYQIKMKGYMCSCPLHKDNSPSMKIYDKTFYCFSCNRYGDIIEFVEQYFNLNFLEAMQKINIDFNLGINFKKRISKRRLQEIELEKQRRILKKNIINKQIGKSCKRYYIYNRVLNNLKSKITKENWEDIVLSTSYIEEKMEQLDIYIEELVQKKEIS